MAAMIKTALAVGVALALGGCHGKEAVVKHESQPEQAVTSSKSTAVAQQKPQGVSVPSQAGQVIAPENVAAVVQVNTIKVAQADSEHHLGHKAASPTLRDFPADVQKKDPYRFYVTLAPKDASHPYFGVGDKNGFVIDGASGRELVLVRGKTYTFEVHSSALHDVYISASDTGWGGDVIEQGVKGNFVYEGEISFTPDQSTPDIVYYQCQNHKSMGSRIFIVNPGDPTDLAILHKKYGIVEAAKDDAVVQVSDQDVKKKLSYAAMVASSKPAKRVSESTNVEAKSLLAEANGLLEQAKAANAGGQNAQAMALIDDALRKLSAASQMVPSVEVQGEQQRRYEELTKSVSDLKKTHKDKFAWIVKEKGAKAGVRYDERQLDEAERKAKEFAAKGDYGQAISKMGEAEKLVTTALNKMLDAQTVVYKLNLDTPEGEYEYEKQRYTGYIELVPVALEERKPAAAERTMFDGMVKRGEEMYQGAQQYAAKKEYPDAIKLMQEASGQVMRALRLLGVNQ